MHPRAHVAGVDEDGRDSLVEQFGGQRPGQEFECSLACAVRTPAGVGAVCRVAGDVDDKTVTCGEKGHRQLDERDWRAGIDREHAAEALNVEGHQRTDSAQFRRVVHQHVETAQLASRVDPSSPNGGIRDVSGNRHDTTRLLSEPIAGAAERLLVPSSNDEVVASLGQHAGNHLAEPAAGAGHDCHPILFSHVHSFEKARPKDGPYQQGPIRRRGLQQARTSSALEVKRKVRQAGIVNEALTISDVARRSGVAPSALRFYEEQRLIHSERNSSGHRRYSRRSCASWRSSSLPRRSGCHSTRSRGARQAAAASRARARRLGRSYRENGEAGSARASQSSNGSRRA
jgi:hypothetical protein